MGEQPRQWLFHKGPPGSTIAQQLRTQQLNSDQNGKMQPGGVACFSLSHSNDLVSRMRLCPCPAIAHALLMSRAAL